MCQRPNYSNIYDKLIYYFKIVGSSSTVIETLVDKNAKVKKIKEVGKYESR